MPTWLLVCMRDIERLKHRPVDNPQGNRQEYNRKNRRRVKYAACAKCENHPAGKHGRQHDADILGSGCPAEHGERLRFGVAPDRIF